MKLPTQPQLEIGSIEKSDVRDPQQPITEATAVSQTSDELLLPAEGLAWIRANEYLTQKAANVVQISAKSPNKAICPDSYPQFPVRDHFVT